MALEWFVKKGDKVAGPFSSKKLKALATQGRVTKKILVCRGTDGIPDKKWVAAEKIKGLISSSDKVPTSTREDSGSQSSATQSLDADTVPSINVSSNTPTKRQSATSGSRGKSKNRKGKKVKETQAKCTACGHVWHYLSSDKLAGCGEEMQKLGCSMMTCGCLSMFYTKTHSMHDKCPKCGSRAIKREKIEHNV